MREKKTGIARLFFESPITNLASRHLSPRRPAGIAVRRRGRAGRILSGLRALSTRLRARHIGLIRVARMRGIALTGCVGIRLTGLPAVAFLFLVMGRLCAGVIAGIARGHLILAALTARILILRNSRRRGESERGQHRERDYFLEH